MLNSWNWNHSILSPHYSVFFPSLLQLHFNFLPWHFYSAHMWERQQNTNTKGSESHQHFPWTHNTRKTPFTFPFILVYCLVVHKSWLYTCRRRQTSTCRLESKITPKNMATWSFWLVFILWKATPEHLSTWCIPEPMNQSLGRAVPSQHQHGAHHVEWSSCSLP